MTVDQDPELQRALEALLFLAPEPVAEAELADALECSEDELAAALARLQEDFAPGARGLVLRRLGGGWTLATAPEAEPAARRLLARPRTPPLTPAQAETLAIVAYLQPVSRPEVDADPRRQRGLGGGHAARPGPGRGGGPLDLRRGPVPDDAAVPQALRPRLAGRPARPRGVGPDARGGGRPARAAAAGRRSTGGREPGGGVRLARVAVAVAVPLASERPLQALVGAVGDALELGEPDLVAAAEQDAPAVEREALRGVGRLGAQLGDGRLGHGPGLRARAGGRPR